MEDNDKFNNYYLGAELERCFRTKPLFKIKLNQGWYRVIHSCNFLQEFFVLGDDKLTTEEKKIYRDKLFELKLQQAYYIMEHKDASPELAESIRQAKHEYAKALIKDKEGEMLNVEHKGK